MHRNTRRLLASALGLGAMIAAGACSDILGIEERELVGTTDDELSCETYCAVALANCTNERALYASESACLGTCEELELGDASDTSGDTVGCRLANAKLAASTGEVDEYCPNAGPGGNDVCGSNCDGYCEIMLSVCPEVFADEDDCATTCAGLTDMHDYSINEQFGDTLDCRLYHVTAATLDTLHCDHASGALKCVPETDGGT